ncbi:hypothetical protein GLOIN_2v1877215 [Rhizophagus clarus]|uniref:Uncharacterized protein n=1 Tax=Rhizophagus clarus TaxID=94130 RepID=A0A8H3QSM6_9GLOM|nr:hypothetical protein GLOIN_2v1877215 [Rhizophagus clarus]
MDSLYLPDDCLIDSGVYADPFVNLTSSKKSCGIILTFILCFDKEKILQFKHELNQFNDNDDNNDCINEENEPLFVYPKYLENYDCLEIDYIIFEWFRNYYNIQSSHEIAINFLPTFHESNLRQSINIKQLNS